VGRVAGCGIPGPTLLAHVAAAGAIDVGAANARVAGQTASELKTIAATKNGEHTRDPTHRS